MSVRTMLTDGSCRWFDVEKATGFREQTRWDGQNQISIATGSQWEHEKLFLTASGAWILCSWSDWQGSLESYLPIDEDAAFAWLSLNECDDDAEFDRLPADVADRFAAFVKGGEL